MNTSCLCSCRSPNICLDGAQMLNKPLGVGCRDRVLTCPLVCSKACHFWGGAVLRGGGFYGFEGAWDSLIEMKNFFLSAVPPCLF